MANQNPRQSTSSARKSRPKPSPHTDAASDKFEFPRRWGGRGLAPGPNYGYFGPTANLNQRPTGAPNNTGASIGNSGWYGTFPGAYNPVIPAGQNPTTIGSGAPPQYRAGDFGEGDDYYGPSYDWLGSNDRATYGSFGSPIPYGPGQWFEPTLAGPQPIPPASRQYRFPGYGQPAGQGPDYFQQERLRQGQGGAASGPYTGVGPRDYVRPDDRILEDVYDRLTLDPVVDGSRITVEVHGGVVTLAGAVPDSFQRGRAESDVTSVRGVRDVENLLNIGPGQYGTPPGEDVRETSSGASRHYADRAGNRLRRPAGERK